jgi:peptide/nickel transport system ATP-binding protein
MSDAVLAVAGLSKRYGASRGGSYGVRALDGVDLEVRRGETLALVGGSGAGKTTLARIVMRLIEPDAGSIRFGGEDLLAMRGRGLRRLRGRLQMVFQDPLAALNPRATVGRLLADPLRVHRLGSRTGRATSVASLLTRVGLSTELAQRYPHELSGGQRQRVNIARALASGPELLVLDEPVSALDVSVRAQILNLLKDIQHTDGLAYLFVSHDLAVVRAIADRVAVMADGRIVETGPVEALMSSPRSELTRALIAAVPRLPASRIDVKGATP